MPLRSLLSPLLLGLALFAQADDVADVPLPTPPVAEAIPAPAPAVQIEGPALQAFIGEMVAQHGFDAASLQALFAQAEAKPQILAILDRPSTSRPYYEFRPNFVNDTRIRGGVVFWREHAALLDAVSQRYGVEPEYLVAILGVETLWGRNTGNFRVLDALATIAFNYPRRAEFFRKELREFLLLARDEGRDPLEFKGSYAGAMGMPQFMPSSFHAFAQDWDGDGKHDLWRNDGDILASIAYYFKQHGWQQGQSLVLPAEIEGEGWRTLAEDKFNLHYKLSELQPFGVRAATAAEGDPLAILAPLEQAAGEWQYWLGLANFYAITRYNRSTHYAMATHELAGKIKAAYLDPSLLPPEPVKAKPAKKRKKRGKRR